eukprot:353991-Chlamydomonas_euryale.AAC.4
MARSLIGCPLSRSQHAVLTKRKTWSCTRALPGYAEREALTTKAHGPLLPNEVPKLCKRPLRLCAAGTPEQRPTSLCHYRSMHNIPAQQSNESPMLYPSALSLASERDGRGGGGGGQTGELMCEKQQLRKGFHIEGMTVAARRGLCVHPWLSHSRPSTGEDSK